MKNKTRASGQVQTVDGEVVTTVCGGVSVCVSVDVGGIHANLFKSMWKTEDTISVIAQVLSAFPALSISFSCVGLCVCLCIGMYQ